VGKRRGVVSLGRWGERESEGERVGKWGRRGGREG